MNKNHSTQKEPGIIWGMLSQEIRSETQRWKTCLLATFVFGLIAHGYGFLNFTINHDSLYEFYLSQTAPIKIAAGRFMEILLRYLMGEIMTLPWLTGLVGLLFVGLAVYLISKMFSLNSAWENLLLSGVCVTNVAVIGIVASYVHDFCGDMLALLLAVCVAYEWHKMKDRISWRGTILGAGYLWAAMGFYQTYLAVTITLMCLDSISDLLAGISAKDAVKQLLRAIPMGMLAGAVYLFCVKVSLRKTGIVMRDDMEDVKVLLTNAAGLWEMVIQQYKLALQDIFLPNQNESVHAVFDPVARLVCAANWGLAVLSGAAIFVTLRKIKSSKMAAFLAVLLILALPLCMLCVNIICKVDHNLTRHAVFLFYLLVLLSFNSWNKYAKAGQVRKSAVLLIALTAIVIFSNIQMANVAYIRKDLERQSTMSTMTRVLARLEQYDDYEYGESKVAFIGDIGMDEPTVKSGKVDVIVGVSYGSQITYIPAMKQYFDIVLQYPINLCDYGESIKVMETETFQKMGVFPEKDSIATIDGIIVVKMS